MASAMAEPKKKVGNCHEAPASTPSGFKVNDHAALYDGRFRVLFSVQSIMDFGRPLHNPTTGWIESDIEPGTRKNAISGWRPGSGNPDILDSAVYGARVLKTAKDISFYIPGARFDDNWKVPAPQHVERFNACHVEKMLALWWVEKVLFFCFKTKDLSRMHELSGVKLPARMAQATVVLNHEPCENGRCVDFLEEIHRITTIKITARQIAFLERRKRDRAEEYPHDEGEGEADKDDQDAHEGTPETPRPAVPRKASDPKVAKAPTYSSPPKPWQRFENCAKPCAKPPTTKVTLEEMRQMYGGDLPSHQSTWMSGPREDESGSVRDEPEPSDPGSQSDDNEIRAVENQRLSEDDSRSSDGPSRPPSATHLQRSVSSSRLEVQLPQMNPERRKEYRHVESEPETPRQLSLAFWSEPSSPASSPAPAPVSRQYTTPTRRTLPNLKRFMYGGGVVTPAKRRTREKTRRPKGLTRVEKARKKSTFLKARERAERQGGKGQNGLDVEPRTPVPVPGTSGGADDDDDEDVFTVPIHPGFLAEYGYDVVMA